ncbi:hypothetical protein CAOG_04234 [Capsaspora owczarzaki ATCC 30864]|uniref:Uncharacterized protein n=1 Tax=Capsaspora owczarzaki (strain ATCC 30864) TaxID=595528 RepID=A0A0D2VRF3_CAPO3|nr:hypothetical protein CAOG_04234 [Capsaspora owczarzaki ATCC 30864]KJE93442.1 hypothetical protein CAOG_004234 [Capsaspora owczarzaki ATCC 30864]|eukprot:XP_004348059.1 hypothetical protein CAOG_04234 [Capsaspora owczarzaki ATCC 30864]
MTNPAEPAPRDDAAEAEHVPEASSSSSSSSRPQRQSAGRITRFEFEPAPRQPRRASVTSSAAGPAKRSRVANDDQQPTADPSSMSQLLAAASVASSALPHESSSSSSAAAAAPGAEDSGAAAALRPATAAWSQAYIPVTVPASLKSRGHGELEAYRTNLVAWRDACWSQLDRQKVDAQPPLSKQLAAAFAAMAQESRWQAAEDREPAAGQCDYAQIYTYFQHLAEPPFSARVNMADMLGPAEKQVVETLFHMLLDSLEAVDVHHHRHILRQRYHQLCDQQQHAVSSSGPQLSASPSVAPPPAPEASGMASGGTLITNSALHALNPFQLAVSMLNPLATNTQQPAAS